MNTNKTVRQSNDLLARELGRLPDGQGKYRWIWSEDQRLMHPMKLLDKHDYKANPDTGLIEVHPVYALRKMCLNATQQWVLCLWIDSPPEHEC